MSTEAQKRAQHKYWEKYKLLPGVREAATQRYKEHRQRLLHGEANREMVDAIQEYIHSHDLCMKQLAGMLGFKTAHLYAMTGYNCWVKPEEFKAVPDLYAKLVEIDTRRDAS